jgi:hypothetical protein
VEAVVAEVDGGEVVLTVEDGVVDVVRGLDDAVELVVVLENVVDVGEPLVA